MVDKKIFFTFIIFLLSFIFLLTCTLEDDIDTLEKNIIAGQSVTVTFNSNGGSTVDKQTVKRGNDKIIQPENPTRPSYAFGGWYRDSGFNNIWNFDQNTVAGNIALYAKWDFLEGT